MVKFILLGELLMVKQDKAIQQLFYLGQQLKMNMEQMI